MDCFDLSGTAALVTGSSKGIGRSIAEHLARAGARVVISSRKPEPCEQVAAGLRAQGHEAFAVPCNISHTEDLPRLVEESKALVGPLDTLVCNAAANPYHGPLVEISEEAYRKTVDTSILSTLRLAGLVLPAMSERGGGTLIAVSSVGSLKGTPGLGAYALSKAALNQVVRSLAVEWGRHNIRINAILPGLVKTDFARKLWEDPAAEERVRTRFPMGRLGEPDDIGPAAVFLAARAGAWMTGQTLVIDGGNIIMN